MLILSLSLFLFLARRLPVPPPLPDVKYFSMGVSCLLASKSGSIGSTLRESEGGRGNPLSFSLKPLGVCNNLVWPPLCSKTGKSATENIAPRDGSIAGVLLALLAFFRKGYY